MEQVVRSSLSTGRCTFYSGSAPNRVGVFRGKFREIDPNALAIEESFDDVQSSISTLRFADVVLLLLQPFREFDLRHSCGLPLLAKEVEKDLVLGSERRFGLWHERPLTFTL
jgi:hypothetical protein